jgi:indole-3-glycerol phosphate synthase
VATYLDRILAAHRSVAAADSRDGAALRRAALSVAPTRGFRSALCASRSNGEPIAVIAEVKRRSPSKGDLFSSLDPSILAQQYESGGATCMSVLTDSDFFGGSVADLQAAREACTMPVLRKDFTVCANDVFDARLMGADCVLLIAAALTPDELKHLHGTASEVGLDVLVEVHDEKELDVALGVGADLIGVNQRDLVTFAVDHERAIRMGGHMPADVVAVAESGVRGVEDATALHEAGYTAVLVGETLVTSGDPQKAVANLRGRG